MIPAMESLSFHPILAHFPVVLAVLFPFVTGGLLIGILRGNLGQRAWILVVLHAGLLFATAGAAVKTGEIDEAKIERIVPEHLVHSHEEAAEILLALAGLSLVASGGALVRSGTDGLRRGMMWASMALSLGCATVSAFAGYSGISLVYVHGAAEAHRPQAVPADSLLFETPSDDGDERDVE